MGSILSAFFTLLLILVSLVLIFLVLLQRANTNAGLGTAFGGGLAESTFGADAGGLLKKWTFFATVAFFVLSLGLYLGYISGAGGPQVEEGALPASISETIPTPISLPDANAGDDLGVPAMLQTPDLEAALEAPAESATVPAEESSAAAEESGESAEDDPNQN